jgi:hypothetical protein
MTKTNDTLVEDMENVILGLNGWDNTLSEAMANTISDMAGNRFSKPQEPRGYLSMSSLGTPCNRKLWYKINQTTLAQPLRANALLKFFYGDMIEELALCIAQQAGHSVTGQQDRMEAHGIKGSRDCVINGMTVDVKSASPYSFKKFQEGNLREQDPFGYISQLSSYVYAAKDDPTVTNKTQGAFLVIDKVNGHICLDMYDFTEELKTKEAEIKEIKAMVKQKVPPARSFEDVPQSKTSPNMKLGMECSYCEFKKACWPGLKMFAYSHGPVYLTKVKKELRIEEVKDWE